jgi:hypothetical protein
MHLHFDSAHNAHFVYEPSVCLIGLGFRWPHGTIRPPPNEKTPRFTHPSSAIPHSMECPSPRDFQHRLLSLEPHPPKHEVKEQVIPLQVFPVFQHSWRFVTRPRGKVRKLSIFHSVYIANFYQATVSFFPPETFCSG